MSDTEKTIVANSADVRNEMYRTRYYSVEELLALVGNGKLSFLPKSKGREGWTSSQQSRMIETVLVGQPQPVLMIDATDDEWYLVAGENELRALLRFVKGNFELNSLFYSSADYDQRNYTHLSYHMQRRLMNYKFMVTLVDCGGNKLSRLWVYTTESYRQGVYSQETCRKVIFSEEYGTLTERTRQLGIAGEEERVWMLAVMRSMLADVTADDMAQNDAFKLDFNTYLSMCMIGANEIMQAFLTPGSAFARRLPETVRALRKSNKTSGYTVKMRRCLALLLANYQWEDTPDFFARYKSTWKRHIILKTKPHRGTSVESYMACCHTMAKKMKLQKADD